MYCSGVIPKFFEASTAGFTGDFSRTAGSPAGVGSLMVRPFLLWLELGGVHGGPGTAGLWWGGGTGFGPGTSSGQYGQSERSVSTAGGNCGQIAPSSLNRGQCVVT
ncbi:hypothetical protein GCM10009859_22500 [Kocuria salsicia]